MQSGVLVAGKYRILRELGAGGMGSVWQAVNVATEREFAIKFLHASCASSASLLTRFFQEARVSGKLRHPSIIEIYDVGTAPELGGAPFLVMELLDGASLDTVLRKVGALPPRFALEAIAEVARALALAHDKGIVHRDLKPANIYLHRPGTGALVPKVLDFGISKIARADAPDVSSGLTQTGAVLGSPLYMSPEQASSDKTVDGRSDVHALGVVLWECLVGQPPFGAESYNNLIVQIITGSRPRLTAALPFASKGLASIVERAMARPREDRFQSARELADALDAELATLGPEHSLTTRTAAAELFARVGKPSIRPEPTAPGGSTTGGMEVPSSRGVSPMASSRMSDPLGFEDTRAAPVAPTLAATVAAPVVLPGPVAAITARAVSRETKPRRGMAPFVVGGAGVAAVVAVVALVLGSRQPAAAPAPPLASQPSPAMEPTPAPAPTASVASPTPTTPPTASAPPAPAPRPVVTAGAPAATAAARPTVRPAPKSTKDSVESSGF